MCNGIDRQELLNLSHGQSCISWLPLAHVFEQFTIPVCLVIGVKIELFSGANYLKVIPLEVVRFFCGDITKLMDDLKELKPTYFGVVSRVFNKVYEKINQQVSKLTGFKK
jgi:long-chain acyl-CoA synthetase